MMAAPLATAWGCAGTQEPPPETPSTASSEGIAAVEPPLPPLPQGHVWRVQVMRVMSPGMGHFLQRLDVREELDSAGKFTGFKILRLKGDPSFWQGVDLKIGDVVTRANGVSVEHYKDVFKVWQSLATTPVLEVSYLRNGQPKLLSLEIHDEGENPGAIKAPAGPVSSAAPSGAPPAGSAAAPVPASSAR